MSCKGNGGAGYAGRADWRLPSINELKSLIDRGKGTSTSPAINETFFPETSIVPQYWSSTSHPANSNYAWMAQFHRGGSSGTMVKSYSDFAYVRCVRGP